MSAAKKSGQSAAEVYGVGAPDPFGLTRDLTPLVRACDLSTAAELFLCNELFALMVAPDVDNADAIAQYLAEMRSSVLILAHDLATARGVSA